MRNRIVVGMAALALVAAMTGCKKEPTIIGKWTGTMKGQETSIEFKDEKAFNIDAKLPVGDITLIGEYKLEGKNLTLNFKDVKVKTNKPANDQKLADMIKPSLKEEKGTAELKTADELALTLKGPDGKDSTEILKRVKDKA